MSKRITILSLIVLLVAGCASEQIKQAERYEQQKDWYRAVIAYRAELAANPGDVEIKSALARAELNAAEYYYKRGVNYLDKHDYDAAVTEFEQGLIAKPDYPKLLSSLKDAAIQKDVMQIEKEGDRYIQLGEFSRAEEAFRRALEISPNRQDLLAKIHNAHKHAIKGKNTEFALSSSQPVTLNFKKTDLRLAFEFLAKSFGINVIFDDDVKDKEVTLFAKNMRFRQALDLMLSTTQTFYKKVGPNTLIIAPDTKDKRGQYEDYLIRTFPLMNASAKEMADILKGVMTLQKVVVNDSLNTITIRDKPEALALAEHVIRANDLRKAEIILDVEVLEVYKTKAEQLGFDYGSSMSATFPPHKFTDKLSDTLEQGTLTLPTITFRYFKQSVNAKTLANPKIRVVNGSDAKIHIGDRVPLRSSTIQDATGQTRTTYEYTDIGIKLDVTPKINLDNSSLVKLNLEVSSLGQNLGTAAEPAYSIGTRNAQTSMLLRDGETAILGGLIRDDDRRARVTVPGLGDIPILGSLFSQKDDSNQRTDVLLTITPHVIRPWELAPEESHGVYSGTADTYKTSTQFDTTVNNPNQFRRPYKITDTSERNSDPNIPALWFGTNQYRCMAGEDVSIALNTRHFQRHGKKVTVRLEYAPALLDYVGLDGSSDGTVKKDNTAGVLVATFDNKVMGKSGNILGKFIFHAKKEGVSQLIAITDPGDTEADTLLVPGSAYVRIEK